MQNSARTSIKEIKQKLLLRKNKRSSNSKGEFEKKFSRFEALPTVV